MQRGSGESRRGIGPYRRTRRAPPLPGCPSRRCGRRRCRLRAQVDEAVGGLDDVEVVLDDDDGVAGVGQAVEHAEEPVDVLEVQAGGRLVEDVERLAGGAAAELLGELDALRLAAGESRRRLPEVDVVEADVAQCLELLADRRDVLRETRAPRRRSGRAPRRCSCPCSAPRASRGCSACPCTPRR